MSEKLTHKDEIVRVQAQVAEYRAELDEQDTAIGRLRAESRTLRNHGVASAERIEHLESLLRDCEQLCDFLIRRAGEIPSYPAIIRLNRKLRAELESRS